MADDFITRADVADEIKEICQNCRDTCAVFDGLTPDCESGCGIFELSSKVTAIPAADVRPVMRGKWLAYYDGSNTYGIKTSSDGSTWTSIATQSSSSKVRGGDYINFGRKLSSGIAYAGEIDLTQTKIYIGGDLWWQATA